MYTRVTEQDILDAFIALINENGSTTSQDVKQKLRNDGFWVFQDTISSVLRDNYSALNFGRNFNGKFFTYTEPELEAEDDTEDDEDLSVVSTDQKPKRGKILGEPTMLDADIYSLKVSHNDKTFELVITDDKNLEDHGVLVYEIITKDNTWYLYASDPSIITRHRAIYYVWKVISQEYDGFVAYADLRSKKVK
jgi:hypothetical protein